ncbi:hypothetical protein [Mangrovicoccus algicola]|uniref:H+/citrate symporter n=1 Tax=Mangrovicoccus algicola TaxID=2771008 RepID=A0A8J6YUG8_9RHOB|nr:hypothetical protein [Mangrovicoccus algicola]MBE3637945.1 hypothetical protein [Mangrovicoccus algicola]
MVKPLAAGPTRTGGGLLALALVSGILGEFACSPVFSLISGGAALAAGAVFWPGISWTSRAFMAIALALVLISAAFQDDWRPTVMTALTKAGFIAAFFTAINAMRAAATGSDPIVACGRFLAGQPPGRRYLALTLGGHLFGLILIYGGIALLGTLATEAANKEPDPEIRRHRIRRMLVAIQRGFVSTLPWSPLSFASAITLSIVPGADWAAVLPYTLAGVAVFTGVGWALDTIFKPRLSVPPPARGPAEGDWLRQLRPLLLLLGLLAGLTAVLHLATGVRIVGVVMAIVPAIALIWTAFQAPGGRADARHAWSRARHFALSDMPGLRDQTVLLVMAAFIGTMGGHLAAPVMAASGIDLGAISAPVLLVALFWIVPLTGQIGMNPILAVSMIGPILPAPEAIGVTPAAMVVAITSGWALSGATSPFTASTLLVADFGKVSARRVGLVWNGPYTLVCGAILSVWIAVLAATGL